MPRAKAFVTEVDLCAAFIAALPKGWTPYAECCGWDILLVRDRDGFQVGVQAKLKLNPLVLAQALDENRHSPLKSGPDCKAVLVPWDEVGAGLGYICPFVGITIIRMPKFNLIHGARSFDPRLPDPDSFLNGEWYENCPFRRCRLPEYVPDVPAGAPSPLQLTKWKVGAIKIAVIMELRGFVTRGDFKHVGIDHRRWISPGTGWLQAKDGRWYPGAAMPAFSKQHPKVYAQIKSEAPKWMPMPIETQRAML